MESMITKVSFEKWSDDWPTEFLAQTPVKRVTPRKAQELPDILGTLRRNEFIQNYPAACHVDNTARPQVISKNENKLAWMILDEYEKLTGEKALINTSFNLHNYPIIESPEVAIDSWKKSNTHCLYVGNEKSGWKEFTRK